MNIKKRMGPRIEPCGTPKLTFLSDEVVEFVVVDEEVEMCE